MGRGGIPKESYPDSRPISSLQPKPIGRLPPAIAPKRDGLCSLAQKQTQSPMCWLTNANDPSPFTMHAVRSTRIMGLHLGSYLVFHHSLVTYFTNFMNHDALRGK